jgi:hypothetical protein
MLDIGWGLRALGLCDFSEPAGGDWPSYMGILLLTTHDDSAMALAAIPD